MLIDVNMEQYLFITGINAIAVAAMMLMLWIVSLIIRNAGIVDIFWSLGFVLITVISWVATDDANWRSALILVLTIIWGLRLSLHIFIRQIGKREDRRYGAWRLQHGKRFWIVSLWLVFGLQGLLLWIISMSLQVGIVLPSPDTITVFDFIGIALWAFGFLWEAIGDTQLFLFKRNPANKGKVFDRGLWRFSRHPNYFGEAVLWWGFYVLSVSSGWGALTFFSPVILTFLLLRVSGVAMLDRFMKASNPQYAEYIESTNAFLPGFRKKG